MVTAGEISKRFGMPLATLYRRVESGEIPYVEVTRSWHKRKQYRFKVSEVAKVIGPPKARPG